VSKVAPDGTAYDALGPERAPVLMLIHGLGLCRQLWRDPLPALSENHRVVTYDLYGHGDSKPLPEPASLTVYAKQLADLMDHENIEQATIIGFSIGGMINRRFAMDYPSKVSGLIILNSPHDRGEAAQQAVEDRAKKVRESGAEATLPDALKRWFTPTYLTSGKGVQSVREWRLQTDAESYAQAAWVLANGVRELTSPQVWVENPTLIMTCENDTGSTPDMSREIAKEISGSETIIVPHLQHLGLLEKPDLFTQPIVEFLERKLS